MQTSNIVYADSTYELPNLTLQVMVKTGPGFLDNEWFSRAKLDYAENLLRIRDDRLAIICLGMVQVRLKLHNDSSLSLCYKQNESRIRMKNTDCLEE